MVTCQWDVTGFIIFQMINRFPVDSIIPNTTPVVYDLLVGVNSK